MDERCLIDIASRADKSTCFAAVGAVEPCVLPGMMPGLTHGNVSIPNLITIIYDLNRRSIMGRANDEAIKGFTCGFGG
jgi:hypothetical protein